MNRFPSISEASSIAIHSLAFLADTQGSVNVNLLATETGFSKNHISKVMQTLVRHGYLSSGRGPKGGFVCRKDSDSITLLEIIELIEGRLSEGHCGIGEGKCPFETCVFGDLPAEFKSRFRDYYRSKKISEIRIARHHQVRSDSENHL